MIMPSDLTRKLSRASIWLINGMWAIPVVLLIRVLRPIVLFRMGTLESTRIGHFVTDGAEQLARYQQRPTNTFDWYWLGETCNSQWERMIRRSLPVHACVKYLDRWNRVLPGGSDHERPSSYTFSRDIEGLFARFNVEMPFLPTETVEALAWLRSKGWKDGEPFVCLLVRDDEYLANDRLHGDGTAASFDRRSYHSYRNSDIDTYLPAIRWLTGQGVWVIRMGKLMAKPLPTGMDLVVDYAFDHEKSDLLDIWLFANCTGCVSTATGLDQLSMMHDRPLLCVNALPLSDFFSWGQNMWTPKTLQWAETGQILSISENLVNKWSTSREYDMAGIKVVNLRPDEITAAVQEFWGRCVGTWEEDPKDFQRQEEFWNIFEKWPEYAKYHGERHKSARAGAAWLSSLSLAATKSVSVAIDNDSIPQDVETDAPG